MPKDQSRGLLATSCCLSEVRPLLDVVDEGVQLPLAIDFLSAAQREPIQSLVVADIAEHRLDGGEALAILLSAFIAFDMGTHRLRMGGYFFACAPRDLSHFAGIRFAQALGCIDSARHAFHRISEALHLSRANIPPVPP